MRGRSSQVGVLVLLLVLLGYLRVVPPAPDLAVQVARAEVVHRVGLAVWWPGWFAGLHLPTYSELGPLLIAALGAPLTGVLAAVAAVALSTRLLQSAVRPRLATGGFAVMVVLNLLDGRITFLVGVAFACGPLSPCAPGGWCWPWSWVRRPVWRARWLPCSWGSRRRRRRWRCGPDAAWRWR